MGTEKRRCELLGKLVGGPPGAGLQVKPGIEGGLGPPPGGSQGLPEVSTPASPCSFKPSSAQRGPFSLGVTELVCLISLRPQHCGPVSVSLNLPESQHAQAGGQSSRGEGRAQPTCPLTSTGKEVAVCVHQRNTTQPGKRMGHYQITTQVGPMDLLLS